MITRTACSFCYTMTGDRFCPECSHRADLPRAECDCVKCRRFESPKDEAGNAVAVGDEVEFLEPHQGFKGGTVVELFRGVSGPTAGVRLSGRGRVVDMLCRQLKKSTGE